jgi:pimeloyl-ACP methyl ester carboxylesterase
MRSEIFSGRTRLGKHIVAEFWMPKKASGKVAILCDGCPSLPHKKLLAEFFARKGYWVFHPRYTGSWESTGEFLRQSPAEDIDTVIDILPKGFCESWTGVTYYLEIKEVLVVGVSFGGTAAILATQNAKVGKAIAIAPVVDWHTKSKKESFDEFVRVCTEGFPGAYRCPKKNFKKLLAKKFYDPIACADVLDGKKLFIVHAKDDQIVSYVPAKKLARKIGATYVERARGGHLSSTILTELVLWRRVQAFLKK